MTKDTIFKWCYWDHLCDCPSVMRHTVVSFLFTDACLFSLHNLSETQHCSLSILLVCAVYTECETQHCSLSTLLVCAVYTECEKQHCSLHTACLCSLHRVWDTALFSIHTACLCSLHRLWDTALFSLLTAWQLSPHKPRERNNAFSFHTAGLFSAYKQSMEHTVPFSPLLVC